MLTAGCASHDASTRPSTTDHHASAHGTASPPTPTTPSPTSTPTPPAARGSDEPTCATDQLAVSVHPDAGGGAAGSTYDDVVLHNSGGSPCLMTGWPGVSYVAGSHGTQVGSPAARQGTPGVVELQPGASATALLQVADPGDFGSCTTREVRGFRIYPPNQRDAVFVAHPGTACTQTSADQLTIRPVTRAT